MFEYVKNCGLSFAWNLAYRKKTNLIVLHHSEGSSSETVQSIHEWHKALGHAGIDYNVCVERDGTAVWGRGLDAVGGHTMNKVFLPTYGVNARSVGVCCLGNFNRYEMPDAQKAGLKHLVADLVKYYGFSSVSQIVTHKGLAGESYTDCPGKNFPYEEVIQYIMNGGSDTAPVPYTFKVTKVLKFGMNDAELVGVTEALTRQGYTGRGATSRFDENIRSTVLAFQASKGLRADGKVGKDTTIALGGTYGK